MGTCGFPAQQKPNRSVHIAATLTTPSGDQEDEDKKPKTPSPNPSPRPNTTPRKKRVVSLKKHFNNAAAKFEQIEREVKGHDPPVRFRTLLDKAKRNAARFQLWASELAAVLEEDKEEGPSDDDYDENLQHFTGMLESNATGLAAEAQLLHGAIPPEIKFGKG
ncbi:hypothetical protein PG985_010391 [Apiospora marii]|uniref:Ribosome assembly protein 3 n=1 Tax=Apiospora marii TaxID=335849 RepID=A0ABR1RNT8_9PEZI